MNNTNNTEQTVLEEEILEIWKPIPDFENYEASNLGRIRSLKTASKIPKILKLRKTWDGYSIIQLSNNKKKYNNLVHRLILKTFIGPSPLDASHMDGNKENNHLSNLRYMTRKENEGMKRIHNTLIFGSKHKSAKLIEPQVLEIRKLKKEGNITNIELSKMFNVSDRMIGKIVKREKWTHI